MRYLALDQILPGDVVLSSARTLRSSLIRVATGSLTASHAAIAIHPLIWFEAVGSGVQYRIIEPELVSDGKRVRLAIAVPKGERYSVRSPVRPFFDSASAVERHGFVKRLIGSTSRFAFLNYARPTEFLATLKLGLGDSAFARFLASSMDRNEEVFFPGPFCSWLVAECYRDFDAKLFGVRPQAMTPAALERSSHLESRDVTITGTPVDRASHFAAFDRDLRVSVALASRLIEGVSSGAHLAKTITSINESIRRIVGARWHLRGEKLPPQSTNALNAIEAEQLVEFKEWQARAQSALEHAYQGISVRTEQVGSLTGCHARCLQSSTNNLACAADRCREATRGTLQTINELSAVFRQPEFSWDDPEVAHPDDSARSAPPSESSQRPD